MVTYVGHVDRVHRQAVPIAKLEFIGTIDRAVGH